MTRRNTTPRLALVHSITFDR